ncbi:sensor histidine kinase [Ideonella sp. DXS29W]|uniref:histidine kinase n=1 Tax=Ideonella lacteola TaxID=2984193 RepID=A0ABU9BW54_9BURK
MSRAEAATHGPSVRRALLRPLLWSWGIGLFAAVIGAYLLARTSANLAFDRGLQDEVSALAAKVTWSDRGPLLDLSRQAMELVTWDRDDRNGYVMVDVDGNPLAGDSHVPVPSASLRKSSFTQPRLFDGEMEGEPVRGAVFSISSPMLDRSVAVIVVETKNKRTVLMRDLQLSIVLPALALGTVTFVMIGWGIRRGLQPLRDVATDVARRDSQDWRPLPLQHVPREAVPLIERINSLLADVEQSIQLQRRFVADAAHQLRTPVAGIRVLAQSLAQELEAAPPGGQGQQAGWQPLLSQLERSTDRLSRLIGQLLSLARSETALSLDSEHQTMDVVPLLRESAEPLVLQALRQGRHIALEAPDEPVPARAHPIWLGEVVNNLLDNALRYGGPKVTLRVAPLPEGGALVSVEDDGQGVAADQLAHLFEPFWRGDRADLRNDGGTGLGLTIAREVVLRLGGTIEAHTRPEFDGLRFTIRLAK